jgi:membrane-associated phospholipid phosphatase
VNPVDKLLLGWVGFLTGVLAVRAEPAGVTGWLLVAHGLFGLLILLFTRLRPEHRVGMVIHDVYPLVLLGAFYTELGVLAEARGYAAVIGHDRIVQGWEAAVFAGQPAYEWIRARPSVFWSGLLHLAYLGYYPIIYVPPLLLLIAGRRHGARNLILATMTAFILCYVVFATFPVAGPNYVFEHPTGPVRDVWSARIVYGILDAGSAIGTAFPSSHVAATMAAVGALWTEWKPVFWIVLIPAMLLVVSTVYCQMHYVADATAGLGVAVIAVAATRILRRPVPTA